MSNVISTCLFSDLLKELLRSLFKSAGFYFYFFSLATFQGQPQCLGKRLSGHNLFLIYCFAFWFREVCSKSPNLVTKGSGVLIKYHPRWPKPSCAIRGLSNTTIFSDVEQHVLNTEPTNWSTTSPAASALLVQVIPASVLHLPRSRAVTFPSEQPHRFALTSCSSRNTRSPTNRSNKSRSSRMSLPALKRNETCLSRFTFQIWCSWAGSLMSTRCRSHKRGHSTPCTHLPRAPAPAEVLPGVGWTVV